MQSLSLDMLKRVTDMDVYLDNVLRRKAAADAKSVNQFRKTHSSQEIAETDSKLRNQLTRFLVSSQKSKHHSRLKVVTWVVCSMIAKTYALLLSDDKLPEEVGGDGNHVQAAQIIAESDKQECECCFVVLATTLAPVRAIANATLNQATKKKLKKKRHLLALINSQFCHQIHLLRDLGKSL